jgi:hypothetical protein
MTPQMLKQRKYTRAVHSAVFCEVRVNEKLGMVRVTRAVVNAVAAGRIISAKTAESQISRRRSCGASARRCTKRPSPTTAWAAS